MPKDDADLAMDAAACIGCGACVAACPNASAMLFVAAKATHLNALPQGQPERYRRVRSMIETDGRRGFGSCTNHAECEAACPKEIPITFISRLNRDYLKSGLFAAECESGHGLTVAEARDDDPVESGHGVHGLGASRSFRRRPPDSIDR